MSSIEEHARCMKSASLVIPFDSCSSRRGFASTGAFSMVTFRGTKVTYDPNTCHDSSVFGSFSTANAPYAPLPPFDARGWQHGRELTVRGVRVIWHTSYSSWIISSTNSCFVFPGPRRRWKAHESHRQRTGAEARSSERAGAEDRGREKTV